MCYGVRLATDGRLNQAGNFPELNVDSHDLVKHAVLVTSLLSSSIAAAFGHFPPVHKPTRLIVVDSGDLRWVQYVDLVCRGSVLSKTSSNELQMVNEVLSCQHPSSCAYIAAHVLSVCFVLFCFFPALES